MRRKGLTISEGLCIVIMKLSFDTGGGMSLLLYL